MSAITVTVSVAGMYLAVAGGVLWKLGRCVCSDVLRSFPGGHWLNGHPDQACLAGVTMLLAALGLALACRR